MLYDRKPKHLHGHIKTVLIEHNLYYFFTVFETVSVKYFKRFPKTSPKVPDFCKLHLVDTLYFRSPC